MKITFFLSCFLSALPVTNYASIRDVGDIGRRYGQVVADIESHLPTNHPYRDNDRITWVHEGTHGINSILRNTFGRPGFYVLENKAILLNTEPQTTIGEVARMVPVSLRGDVYRLYMVDMRRYWEHQPSYIFDEFVAYTNGADARNQLRIHDRAETVKYMLEFCVYSACVPRSVKEGDEQLRLFLMFQAERAIKISNDSGIKSEYLIKLCNEPDANELRIFMRKYFGKRWAKETLGF